MPSRPGIGDVPFATRSVPISTKSVPFGTQTGTTQQNRQRTGYWEETVAEQGVFLCKTFLFEIKNVFAKFDNRLG